MLGKGRWTMSDDGPDEVRPLPWQWLERGPDVLGDADGTVVLWGKRGIMAGNADANFLIRAVNSHDELMTVLEEVTNFANMVPEICHACGEPDGTHVELCVIGRARALLERLRK